MPPRPHLRPQERSQRARQTSGRGGLKCPVGRSKTRPLDLAPKHIQFVPEHDNFEILGGFVLSLWDQQPE